MLVHRKKNHKFHVLLLLDLQSLRQVFVKSLLNPLYLKGFGLILSSFKTLIEVTKFSDGSNVQKFYASHDSLINPYEVSLMGK